MDHPDNIIMGLKDGQNSARGILTPFRSTTALDWCSAPLHKAEVDFCPLPAPPDTEIWRKAAVTCQYFSTFAHLPLVSSQAAAQGCRGKATREASPCSHLPGLMQQPPDSPGNLGLTSVAPGLTSPRKRTNPRLLSHSL